MFWVAIYKHFISHQTLIKIYLTGQPWRYMQYLCCSLLNKMRFKWFIIPVLHTESDLLSKQEHEGYMCVPQTHPLRLFWRKPCSCHRWAPHNDTQRPHRSTPGRSYECFRRAWLIQTNWRRSLQAWPKSWNTKKIRTV